MAGKNNDTNMPMVHCSFCGKTEKQVHKLIAGPNGVYICDECIDLCDEILAEEFQDDFDTAGRGNRNQSFKTKRNQSLFG